MHPTTGEAVTDELLPPGKFLPYVTSKQNACRTEDCALQDLHPGPCYLIGNFYSWRDRQRLRDARAKDAGRTCECGYYLGVVTLHTKGLCPGCGLSIWMQVARSYKPKSEAIAAGLNRRKSSVCIHQHSHCYSRCGVELGPSGWRAIDTKSRDEWFDRVIR